MSVAIFVVRWREFPGHAIWVLISRSCRVLSFSVMTTHIKPTIADAPRIVCEMKDMSSFDLQNSVIHTRNENCGIQLKFISVTVCECSFPHHIVNLGPSTILTRVQSCSPFDFSHRCTDFDALTLQVTAPPFMLSPLIVFVSVVASPQMPFSLALCTNAVTRLPHLRLIRQH
jgi:hypothetical protein